MRRQEAAIFAAGGILAGVGVALLLRRPPGSTAAAAPGNDDSADVQPTYKLRLHCVYTSQDDKITYT